jgi:murein DD-endopeptidase MepM/ murein hydrolase activator NlpD
VRRSAGWADDRCMTRAGNNSPPRWLARIGSTVVVLAAVAVPLATVPASTTARAAPPVSAAPAAVVGAPSAETSSRFSGAVSLVRWSWPVGPPQDLVRAFEAPATPYSAGHRGIDIGAAAGAPVRAPADGVVSFAGTVVDRPVLSIQHADGLVSSLEPVAAAVRAGERVSADQVVGVVAAGAHCSGRCVHFGVRRNGQYLNPMLFLGGVTRAVLLPLPGAG